MTHHELFGTSSTINQPKSRIISTIMFSQVTIVIVIAALFSSNAFNAVGNARAATRALKMVVVDDSVPGQIPPTGVSASATYFEPSLFCVN